MRFLASPRLRLWDVTIAAPEMITDHVNSNNPVAKIVVRVMVKVLQRGRGLPLQAELPLQVELPPLNKEQSRTES